jgi:hypothetical protein
MAPEAPPGEPLVHRRPGELGHRALRVPAQVPANRLGFGAGYSLAQLKILQEVITLAVFAPFAMLYMGEALKWNYVWASLCLVGAVYFISRARLAPACAGVTHMRLHILGICGTFMGGLAKIAIESGHAVTGCDAQVYPR